MKLDFSFDKLIPIPNVFEGSGFEKLKRSLLTILLRQKDQLFQASRDPDGNTWTKLSTKAERRKTKKNRLTDEQIAAKGGNFKSHKILVDTGELKNSLTSPQAPYQVGSTTGNVVELGTNVPYAAIQNFGGTIQNPKGYSIVIPPRPFIGFGANDDKQVTEKIEAFVEKQGKV